MDNSVISGNANDAIVSVAGTTGNTFDFDHFGTDATGTINLGLNTVYAVLLNGTSGNSFSDDTVANDKLWGIVLSDNGGDWISNITFFNNTDGDYHSE